VEEQGDNILADVVKGRKGKGAYNKGKGKGGSGSKGRGKLRGHEATSAKARVEKDDVCLTTCYILLP